MEFTKEVSRTLNHLLEKSCDAEKGYQEAAEKIENPRMKKFLERQAKQRKKFSEEIKKEIRNYGETPEEGGSATGALHRIWIDLKSVFSSDNDENIMEEVERGEKEAIEDYNEIIAHKDLPPATKRILIDQRELIEQAKQSAANFEKIS